MRTARTGIKFLSFILTTLMTLALLTAMTLTVSAAENIPLDQTDPDPSITVGGQTNKITYGTAVTASEEFTVTALNFTEPVYSGEIEWISTAHDGVTLALSSDGTKVLVTTTAAANAGEYKFKIKSGDVESGEAILTISKAVYPGTVLKTVYIATGRAVEQTRTLTLSDFFTTVPAGAKFDKYYIVAYGQYDQHIICTYSHYDYTIVFASHVKLRTPGLTDKVELYILTTNYEKITATLKFTTVVSTAVTISNLSLTDRVYNGSRISENEFGTPSFSPAWTGTLVYTYFSGTSAATGLQLAGQPMNVGDYVLRAAIPSDDPEYTGYVDVPFTITKKGLTIRADDKSMIAGKALPAFTYTYEGLAGSDLESNIMQTPPTATCAANGKIAGTYTIKLSDAVLNTDTGNNYFIESQTDGTLTVMKSSERDSFRFLKLFIGFIGFNLIWEIIDFIFKRG